MTTQIKNEYVKFSILAFADTIVLTSLNINFSY